MINKQLFYIALIAGQKLFGIDPNRGLAWGNTSQIEYHDLDQYPIEVDENLLGTEEYPIWPEVDDYEYQFFPSTNTGKDVSGELIRDLEPDTDGKIYLYHTECGIRIINTVPKG